MKQCNECLGKLPLDKFGKNKNSKDKHDGKCLVCKARLAKQYRPNNRELTLASYKRFDKKRRADPNDGAKRKNIYLKWKYNIPLETYNEMFDKQKGCCAICSKHQSTMKRALAVDHNHTTGEVRSLLCGHCNLMLGYAKDSISVLEASIKYLQGHS